MSFKKEWDRLKRKAYLHAVDKGFHDTDHGDPMRIALMHSELSEALEALRHGDHMSDKIPEFTGVEEELADVVIRIMDAAGLRGWDIAGAIEAKMAYNEGRERVHGGKRF